ncbi:MAG: hypothetical protein J6Z17_03285, partial [Treponema sp.]|nr:hypothetical protein [Treponema sp.]
MAIKKTSTAAKKTAVSSSKKSAAVVKSAASKSSAVSKTAVKPAAAKSASSKTASVKTVAKKTVAAKVTSAKTVSKKPAAGIDENGTFRAWGNAKTVAKPKTAKEEKAALENTKARQAQIEKKLAAAKAIDPGAKSPAKKAAAYTDEQIRHLDALEHIRLRSGMY